MKDLIMNDKIAAEYILKRVNTDFFEGALPDVCVAFVPSKKAYGHFAPNRWAALFDPAAPHVVSHEINLSPSSYADLLSATITLFHETVHLANWVDGVKDVAPNGRHSGKFLNRCLKHHLFARACSERCAVETPHVLEAQDEEFKTWFEDIKRSLTEMMGEEAVEKLFQTKYVFPEKKVKEDDGINTKFICVDTGNKFTIPKKVIKALLEETKGDQEALLDTLQSPFTGGRVEAA